MARTDKVTCYYANPATGVVEKHELSSISWQEATRGHMVERKRIMSGEEHLWTLEPPKGTKADEILDLSPTPFEVRVVESSGPPVLNREHLREKPAARG
jgi:hypothetical protein